MDQLTLPAPARVAASGARVWELDGGTTVIAHDDGVLLGLPPLNATREEARALALALLAATEEDRP